MKREIESLTFKKDLFTFKKFFICMCFGGRRLGVCLCGWLGGQKRVLDPLEQREAAVSHLIWVQRTQLHFFSFLLAIQD